MTRVAVVGGGIAGLASAAELLVASGGAASVVLFEGSDRVGGKLRVEDVGGVTLDVGAEAMLARRPEARELSTWAECDERLTHPATTQASIWTGGALHPMPRTVMGIPAEPTEFVHVERHQIPLSDTDISVAEFVRERVGAEVLERLVEPLLGGVYAGHADSLSLAAAGAQLQALGADPVAAATDYVPVPGPVFDGLVGGVGRLPGSIVRVAEQQGLELRLDTVVRGLEPDGAGWSVSTGQGAERFDAVVVAAPAPAASRLLSQVAPKASFTLADIPYASVAIVTFVFDRELELPGSGFLVPPVDGTSIKGATFSSNKWAWLAEPGRTVLRASLGRYGETASLQYDDPTLAQVALADLRDALGTLPDPAAWHVQRWGGALPQYLVGHLDKVATIDADIASARGLAVCGAAYRGIGIPAVIASAKGAVEQVLADLGD
jgi:oxygen-dependent protoporphyrinogen oxidase